MSDVISQQELRQLVDAWIGEGKQVAAPVRVKPDRVLYTTLDAAESMVFGGFIRPANSIKEFVFPRHEKLYGYRLEDKSIALHDIDPPSVEQVIVAARPCDAASLPILDHVFDWDFRDGFFQHHRERTTVITLACTEHDAHCFCTSVDLAPDDTRGSDVLLLDLGDDMYEVRCLTEKGRALFEGKTTSSDKTAAVPAGPAPRFEREAVDRFLESAFEHTEWQAMTLRCLGCGACAYTCPTCHCFDIVDEGNAAGGVRARNWDACQFGLFTLHASGHNPRTRQAERQRQRIYHKFRMYPEKFGPILCTGCGNCTRNCPVGLGVRPVLESIRNTLTAEVSEQP